MAKEFPFRDIVGVELSPRLAGIARRNAAIMTSRYPGRTAVRVLLADGGAFALPAGDLVIFMYRPFGEEPIARMVARVEAALAAEKNCSLHIVYYNPLLARLFSTSLLLRCRFAGLLA